MKRDHGKVDTGWLVESDSAGAGGPSIPDPVVQPRPVAALTTNPIATSYPSKRKEYYIIIIFPLSHVLVQ